MTVIVEQQNLQTSWPVRSR